MDIQINATIDRLQVLSENVDVFFLIINATVIYFMQCGFAILECGAVRSKNATNILIKNMLDSLIGGACYWLFGYALAFGGGNGFCGWHHWAAHDVEGKGLALVFFHYTFAVTASTIVSGSVAERCNFAAYIFYSIIFTAFMYPVVSHWAWSSEGWLATGINFTSGNETLTVSYQDFAGSGVVHLVGGTAAFFGAVLLGPRIGRFDSYDYNEEEIRGHSVPMAALGGFILFLGFFCFNGGSQARISQPGDAEAVATAVLNTIISGAFGAIVTVVGRVISNYFGINDGHVKWSLLSTINGGLAGMVAICAGCNVVYTWGACCIGAVAGLCYQLVSWLMIKARIDDPLDAVAVHFGAGFWGIIAVCLFDKDKGAFLHPNKTAAYFLAVNLAGAMAIIVWTTVISGGVFLFLKLIKILRVPAELEIKGLDIEEHGEAAYPVSAYKDQQLFAHLRELFEELADPESAKKKKRTKRQAIEASLASFAKNNLVMVNGALMYDKPKYANLKVAASWVKQDSLKPADGSRRGSLDPPSGTPKGSLRGMPKGSLRGVPKENLVNGGKVNASPKGSLRGDLRQRKAPKREHSASEGDALAVPEITITDHEEDHEKPRSNSLDVPAINHVVIAEPEPVSFTRDRHPPQETALVIENPGSRNSTTL